MQHYSTIEHKLQQFIKKYYYNQLIKGGVIFLLIFLILGLIIAAVEYFLWLKPLGRQILIGVSSICLLLSLIYFILRPALKLSKLSKGIDYYKASHLIGTHFKEVNDKLTNILQLKAQNASEGFIAASIEQKSKELSPIPFQLAINFKQNLKYARFAIIPVLIIGAIWISGQGQFFTDSYFRVVNYNQEFVPPAPFQFKVLNDSLKGIAGEDFKIIATTEGDIAPEQLSIHLNQQAFRLQPNANGVVEFNLQNLTATTEFYLSAQNFRSKTYQIALLKTPRLEGLELQLKYPNYINRKPETLNGTGQAIIPEGTQVTWLIKTKYTDQVTLKHSTEVNRFKQNQQSFSYTRAIFDNFKYQLSTNNRLFSNYEQLNYQLKVVKDELPQLQLQVKKDSINTQQTYFLAKVSDDYGLTKAEVVITDIKTDSSFTRSISIANNSFASFNYAVPNPSLNLKPGAAYRYYFRVFDNDAINGQKSVKSKLFYFNKASREEAKNNQLKAQKEALEQINKSLSKSKAEQTNLKNLKQLSKEKQELNYNDQQKLKQFIDRQQQQMQLMENYTEKLKEQLDNFETQDQDKKEALSERLEKNQAEIKQNKKLLEELKKLQDQINQDNLDGALEEFDKEKNKQEKSLEQLLELTKSFYVEEKQKQLANQLKDLAERQEELSKQDESTLEAQKDISEKFKELQEHLDELEQQNEELEQPKDLGRDPFIEENIKTDQSTAEKELSKTESDSNSTSEKSRQKAQQSQQRAAKQMKQLAQGMQQQMMSGNMQQQQEDAELLRQILDNLIVYSIEQEQVMNDFSTITNKNPIYASKLRRQAELRENFKHIDDSLFELAKRNMMVSATINNSIEDIKFNTQKALEQLAENRVNQGVSYQQYIMKEANVLANLLSQSLDQMQQQMMGSGQGNGGKPNPGQGSGSGEQLSDIIQSHEELKEAMKSGQDKGEKEGQQPGNSENSQQGQGQKQGQGKSGGKENNASQKGTAKDGQQEGKQLGDSGQQTTTGQTGNTGENAKEIYQIYKQQQALRQQLEDRIKALGLDANSKALNKSLDQVEQELLMQGFTNDLLKQMENVKHQLLKLEEAANEQGKDQKRQAETNRKQYNAKNLDWLEKSKEYFNSTELLNRQQLPLQAKFKALIKQYFKQAYD